MTAGIERFVHYDGVGHEKHHVYGCWDLIVDDWIHLGEASVLVVVRQQPRWLRPDPMQHMLGHNFHSRPEQSLEEC